MGGSGFLAATFCHEIDHLDGVLFTDKVDIVKGFEDTDVLLSDEVNWHYVLNCWHLHDLNSEDGRWEETETWFDNLPPDQQDTLKHQSWEKIFDKDDPDEDYTMVRE